MHSTADSGLAQAAAQQSRSIALHQPERTALARRTSLAMAANAFLVVRSALQTHRPTLLLLGIALGVAALALIAVGYRRRQQLSRSSAAPSARLIAFMSGSAVLAAIAGVLALLN